MIRRVAGTVLVVAGVLLTGLAVTAVLVSRLRVPDVVQANGVALLLGLAMLHGGRWLLRRGRREDEA